HGYEMAHGSQVRLVFSTERLPLLPGARRLAGDGRLSGGCKRNREWLADKGDIAPDVPRDLAEGARGPPTPGGPLVALPAPEAPRLLEALGAVGVTAAIVGAVEPHADGPWLLLRR